MALTYGEQVKIYLDERLIAILDRMVESIPEAEGSRSRALRIVLDRWDRDEKKKLSEVERKPAKKRD